MERRILLLGVVLCLCLPAGPKQRKWQDATVAKVEQSEIELENQIYRSSAPSGRAGVPVDTGTEKRKVKVWTYQFKTADKVYTGTVEKKPLEGMKEGGRREGGVAARLPLRAPGRRERAAAIDGELAVAIRRESTF